MKKKQLTFAEEAKRIMNKYKARLGKDLDKDDPLARKAMERELSELAAQQEMMKQSMQMDNMEEGQGGQAMPAPAMMAYGGGLPIMKLAGTLPDQEPDEEERRRNPTPELESTYPIPNIQARQPNYPNGINSASDNPYLAPQRLYNDSMDARYGPVNTAANVMKSIGEGTYNGSPAPLKPVPESRSSDTVETVDNRVPWTAYVSPALQAAGSIAAAIASKTMSGNNANVDFVPPQAPAYKKAYFDEARRQAFEKNILAKRSVGGGKYANAAAAQHFDNQYAREVAAIQEQENAFNTRGLNEYNQAMHGYGMKAAENAMQAKTINAGLRAAGDKETAAYINETFNKAAIYPENVARLDAFNKTLPYMGTAFSGSDGNGKFISPAMGLKYYPDSGKYFIDGKEVDNTDLYFEQLKKRRIDNSPSYMAKVKE